MIISSSPGVLLRKWISVDVGRVDSWWVWRGQWKENGVGRKEGRGCEWRTKFRDHTRLIITAVSAPWFPGQPPDTPSVILITKPMDQYLLGDLEADAEDLLLGDPLHWGHFLWPHNPRPPAHELGIGELGDVFREFVSTWWFSSLCGINAQGERVVVGTTLHWWLSLLSVGTSPGWLLSVSNLVFKKYFDVLYSNKYPQQS